MRRSVLAVLSVVCVCAALLSSSLPGEAAPSAPAPADGIDASSAIVELVGDPLTTAAKTHPVHGKKLDFSNATVRSERARLTAQHNDFKQWLQKNAPKAVVTNDFDVALNALSVSLNGASLDLLRSAPMVKNAEYEGLFEPLAHDDPDLGLIFANEAWGAVGGDANAGAGVKVAIIDTGIDATHPCFDDSGYAAQNQLGDTSLTNNKVIAAKVFANKTKKLGVTAAPIESHGTHVAGTVACNAHTPANVNGVAIPYDPSGVAPRALLGNYNVFPGTIVDAKSEDILDALESAYEDGFDVANMSLGDKRNFGGSVMLSHAVDNMDKGNMVVAVAAGNEGPGYFTVGYPGAAARALTAGASTVGHAIVNELAIGGASYQMVVGGFGPIAADITAPLRVLPDPNSGFDHDLNLACNDSPPLGDLTGLIALIGRGVCTFSEKIRNVQNAGATAAVVVNREPGYLTMGSDGTADQPTIPAVLVSLADGALIDDHDGEPATLKALGVYTTQPELTNRMAGFSSQGPTQQDLLVKPDVVAPGADVLSSFPAAFCVTPPCWAIIGGTSMATPHLAGAAAVVRAAHPDWDAALVRSAIVNTAQQNVLRDSETDVVTTDALKVGAGLLDLFSAVTAVAGVDPVSTSFANVSSGAGATKKSTVVVSNLTGTTRTYTATVADDGTDGVTFSTDGGTFTLGPGQSRAITVSAAMAKGAADGPRQVFLRLTSGGAEVAHSVLFVFIGEGDRAPGPHLGNRNKD